MSRNRPIDNLLLNMAATSSTTIGVLYGIASRPDVNVNASDQWGNTALHKAVEIGKYRFVECLLDNNIDRDAINHEGDTALHIVARTGNYGIAKILLEAEAETNVVNNANLIALEVAKKHGNSAIVAVLQRELNFYLIEAVKEGDLKAIQGLIAHGADINSHDSHYHNGLYSAMLQSNIVLAEYLIENEININARDEGLLTVLHIAAALGKDDFTQLFINNGAKVNAIGRNNTTPLHYAISQNSHKTQVILTMLLKAGADYNITPIDDYHFLYKAAFRGYNDIIRTIATDLKAVNHCKSKDHATALHAASMMGHLDVVRMLIHKGADVTVVSSSNYTARSLAEQLNHSDISEYLQLRCIRLISAAANGKLDMVEVLAKKTIINSLEYYGFSALDMAVNHGHKEVASHLLEHGAKIKYDLYGNSILNIAAKNEDCGMMEILMHYGANLTSPNVAGVTALNLTKECHFDGYDSWT